MPEYIEREAATQAAVDWFWKTPVQHFSGAGLARAINAIPAADVVEVVRCEKCVHSLTDGWICGGPDVTMPSHPTYPDAFCSYGERKKVSLEDIVDVDAQTKANNEAMRKVIDFITEGRKDNGYSE